MRHTGAGNGRSKRRTGDELKEYICEENNQFGLVGGHPNPYRAEPKQ